MPALPRRGGVSAAETADRNGFELAIAAVAALAAASVCVSLYVCVCVCVEKTVDWQSNDFGKAVALRKALSQTSLDTMLLSQRQHLLPCCTIIILLLIQLLLLLLLLLRMAGARTAD